MEEQILGDERERQASVRLKHLLEEKKKAIENNKMLDKEKMDIPEELPDLYHMAIWLGVIDEKHENDLYELVYRPKETILRDGSVHSWWSQKK